MELDRKAALATGAGSTGGIGSHLTPPGHWATARDSSRPTWRTSLEDHD
jgi:hypothetical protein